MKVTDESIVVTQLFDYSKEIVWNAITEHNQMINWFFEQIPEFKAEIGFKTEFDVETPNRIFCHLWEIIEVIAYQKIVYNWKYKGENGDSNVSFNLIEEGHSTLLILTTEILENFDNTIPEFSRESCEAGWNYFITERLVKYLQHDEYNVFHRSAL